MVNMRLSVISHGGFTFSFKPPPQKKAEILFITWINPSYLCVCTRHFSLVFKLRQMGISTSLHRHRKLSRSLFSSSSTTVTSGARSETTPRSSGRKGCGPSWAKKDANFRKLCLSVALAVSGNRQRGTTPLQTPGDIQRTAQGCLWTF